MKQRTKRGIPKFLNEFLGRSMVSKVMGYLFRQRFMGRF